jgi:hypothetical protein
MNQTFKDDTVKGFHCGSSDRLRTQLDNLLSAYNFASRPKTMKGLTPYE